MNAETPIEQDGAEGKLALWAHILPFALWLVLMEVLGKSAWAYGLRCIVCLWVFIWFRPWRWYELPRLRNVLPALGVGILVFVIWVLPESPWAARWPALQQFYLRVGTLPPWKLPEPVETSPYAPYVCGWAFSITRLLGSALVIAVIEEFFWRGFLYRWLLEKKFLEVDMGKMVVPMFLIVSLFFGFEHQRWLVGFLAGLAYGGLAIKTRDLWAAVLAHVTTNALLGAYVLATGSYAFW